MSTKKKKKNHSKVGKIIKTVLSAMLCLVLIVVMLAANTVLAENDRMVDMVASEFVGQEFKHIDNSNAKTEGLDLNYNKSDYTEDNIGEAEVALKDQISEEGLVLLKNEN